MEGSRTTTMSVKKADDSHVTLEQSHGFAMDVIQEISSIFMAKRKITGIDITIHHVPWDKEDYPVKSYEVSIPDDPDTELELSIQKAGKEFRKQLDELDNDEGTHEYFKDEMVNSYMIAIKTVIGRNMATEELLANLRQLALENAEEVLCERMTLKEFTELLL